MPLNKRDPQAAFDALFAEFIAAEARKDARVKDIQECFCFACEAYVKTLKQPPNTLTKGVGV